VNAATAHPIDSGTRLAVDRTRLAHERTLMAWTRTAVSLISFGFTIYKFFEFEAGKGAPANARLLSPREFAMIMIGTGLAALVMGTIEHRQSLKDMSAEYGPGRRSVATVVAAIVSTMGVVAFLATLFRV
jgi:putative membrane protein